VLSTWFLQRRKSSSIRGINLVAIDNILSLGIALGCLCYGHRDLGALLVLQNVEDEEAGWDEC